jgi:hypothetical protein
MGTGNRLIDIQDYAEQDGLDPIEALEHFQWQQAWFEGRSIKAVSLPLKAEPTDENLPF